MGAAPREVDTFLADLVHPHKNEILELSRIVLGVDPSIADGVKWNSVSFKTREFFATIHLRAKVGVGLILHLGAKVRRDVVITIDDPTGMLEWLAKDRAMIVFRDAKDLIARRAAFVRIVKQWIRCV